MVRILGREGDGERRTCIYIYIYESKTFIKTYPFSTSAAFVVQIYLRMDRLDLAKKELAAIKSWADDATLAQLVEAWVDVVNVRSRMLSFYPPISQFNHKNHSHH